MLLALWTIILTCGALVSWDWWTHRPRSLSPTEFYDWEHDTQLVRLLADEAHAESAWDDYFDQHGVLRFPDQPKERP